MGRGPHTILVRRRAPPPSLVRALLQHAGVGSPCGRDPRGSRRLGALGRAVCRSSRTPPPASGSLLGEGGRPLGSGGAEGRSCGSQAGGGGGGGGVGGPPPNPPTHSGVALPSVVSGVPPRGILVPWGLPGGRGRQARSGRPPTGQCGGGGGEGEGTPPPWFAPPFSPGRPLIGPLRLRRPWRRRSAVGRQRAGCAGACLGRGAPAPRVQRPLRLLLGLSGRGGGSGGGPLAPWRRLLPPRRRCAALAGPGAAVRGSGQRLAGCGAVGSPLRSLSPPSLPREVARAPSSRRTVGGAWVGGPISPQKLSRVRRLGRHLRRRLCGGWGCGGGGLRRR